MNRNFAAPVFGVAVIFLSIFIYMQNCCGKDMLIKIQSIDQVSALFPKNSRQIKNLVTEIIKKAQDQLTAIFDLKPEERTYDNVIIAFDHITARVGTVSSMLHTLEMVSPDAELRESAHAALIELQSFAIDNFSYNLKLYEVIKEFAQDRASHQPTYEPLNDEEKYYLAELLKGFEKSGLGLPLDEQETIKKLTKELAELSLQFQTNINNENRTITVSKEDLAGVSEKFIDQLPRTESGEYILGTDTPTVLQILENCSVEATRKALWLLYENRAYPQNEVILKKIIALRDKLAKALGYGSFAALDIDDEMAQSPAVVEKFLEDLVSRSLQKLQQEVAEFTQELPVSVTLNNKKLKPWDIGFIKTQYKKNHFSYDEQKVAEYFPLDRTISQLLDIYEQFLAIKFKQVTITPDAFWHSDVRAVEVHKKTGELIGYLLLDLYPRANKYTHACEIDIIKSVKTRDGQFFPAVAVVVANFPKPSPQCPSLLKFNDVTTFFHEFGHAIHELLGTTQMAGFAGTSVKRDFVEMPSQMLEEWMYDTAIIKKVSSHYETGEPLPESILTIIKAVKHFDSADWTLRQLFFSLISLNFFKDGEEKNLQEIKEKLVKRLRPHVMFMPESHFEASFGHLTGYGAKYYGYLWSKVFALDMFNYIKQFGLLNPAIGTRYAQEVIGKGGSLEPEELLENFLGRKPNSDAFFADMGL